VTPGTKLLAALGGERHRTRRLWLLGAAVALVAMCGVPAQATYGARVTADEPQYLLSALSLGEDLDLDISDELAREAYRPFHRADLDRQTEPSAGGRQFSPHDPGLPFLLALPMRLGGWAAAKATLALFAGALAAVTAWVAIRRFAVPERWAVATVAVFALSTPLGVYATQVYPELPAALVVMTVVALITGSHRARAAVATVAGATALVWLSVKYAPVAAALVAVSLLRMRSESRTVALPIVVSVVAGLAMQGALYLVAHRAIYGGWTAYAAGDHFSRTGEFSVVGVDPDYAGRSRRLVGLLVDREFGLAGWAPGWLLLAPALGALARRRPAGGLALLVPALAGWFVATFVALTMHGWWWPGRQVVVILPLLVVVVAWWLAQVAARWRWASVALAVSAVLGIGSWAWTMVEASTRRHVLVVDFMATANPWYRLWRHALPFGRDPAPADDLITAVWVVLLVAAALAGWWLAARDEGRRGSAVAADVDGGARRVGDEQVAGGLTRRR
jgi:hypothetical protein